MNFRQAIEKFIKVQENSNEKNKIKKLLTETIFEFEDFKKESVLASPLSEFDKGGEKEDFLSNIFLNFLISSKSNKVEAFNRFNDFILYMNEYCQFNTLPDQVFDGVQPKIPIERKLSLLKMLQGDKAWSLNDLESKFVISKRNLKEDIKEFENGIIFLDQKIQIDIHREKGIEKYLSTVHPIFLPLNLREVFVMTVGLKKIADDKRNPYGETMNYVADWIYSQLSEYGKEKIDNASKIPGHNDICFYKHDNKYIKDIISETRSIKNKLIMIEKSGETSRIYTVDNPETGYLVKRARFIKNENRYDVLLTLDDDSKKMIEEKSIIHIIFSKG